MDDKLAIIGIDSLDPYIILKYRKELPTFSQLLKESSTFISESVFPIDTIPAWVSIYTGLHPGNHGVLYVYDVFDPNLGDLRKLDTTHIRGKTFWDYASRARYKVAILYPTLMFPAWKVNGIMISKSPYDKRVNDTQTEREISCYPEKIADKYNIPDRIQDIWGGYPGRRNLVKWASIGREVILKDFNIAFKIYKKETWDLFFVYFHTLDIIQHRLWRFFDKNDPMYEYDERLTPIILDFYRLFDKIVGEFINELPDAQFIILSDHGHRGRPVKTVNINEVLGRKKLLNPKHNFFFLKNLKSIALKIVTTLNLEHYAIRVLSMSDRLTKRAKTVYASSDVINRDTSVAWLSQFAGLKSYPHGGIEINKDLVSKREYDDLVEQIIKILNDLRTPNGEKLVLWAKRREELYPGKYTKEIFPDVIFELREDWGVGWDLGKIYGESPDHKVASGGHAKEAVFLIKNINREIKRTKLSILDISSTILDLLNIEVSIDGESIFKV